jgi:hypothetical protein
MILTPTPNQVHYAAIPPRVEGRIAIVTDVEAGSGGRDGSQALDAPDERADLPVSDDDGLVRGPSCRLR